MTTEQVQEQDSVEVQPELEQGSLEELKQKAGEINNHQLEEEEQEPEAVKEVVEAASEEQKKPATTEEVAVATAVADAPSYEPKFKYVHKGQELEVDEFLKPLVKDADSEKKIQEISQKLAFVDDTKDIREKWESSQDTLSMVGECQRLYEEGTRENSVTKLERLVETIGLTDDQIFNIAKAKLDRRKMDPEQRAQIENHNSLLLEKERLMRENEQYQSQLQTESLRAVESQIAHQLERPDVQSLRGTYESIHGAGSFRELLIQEGHAASLTSGQTVPPNLIMEGIIKQYGPFIRQQAVSQQPPVPQVNQQPKKVVPNVSATGSNPGRSRVSSLDDIRKIIDSRNGDD